MLPCLDPPITSLFNQCELINSVTKMSSPLFTQEQAEIDRTPNELLQENQMKDMALSKATNLIELLNIELEVERNSSQEALRALEEELRERYQRQLRQLQQKVQILERQLKKNAANQKSIRSTVLTRANSTRSLQNKLKRSSVNKKYTDTAPNEQTERLPSPQIGREYYRLQLVELEEWRAILVRDLDALVKTEYDELERLINNIETASEDFKSISARTNPSRDLCKELFDVVRAQNKVINSFTAYSQELEDLCKSTNYKLNSLLRHQVPLSPSEFDFQRVMEQLCGVIAGRKEEIRAAFASLEGENSELKSILDSMIKLVKEEKKIR